MCGCPLRNRDPSASSRGDAAEDTEEESENFVERLGERGYPCDMVMKTELKSKKRQMYEIGEQHGRL